MYVEQYAEVGEYIAMIDGLRKCGHAWSLGLAWLGYFSTGHAWSSIQPAQRFPVCSVNMGHILRVPGTCLTRGMPGRT